MKSPGAACGLRHTRTAADAGDEDSSKVMPARRGLPALLRQLELLAWHLCCRASWFSPSPAVSPAISLQCCKHARRKRSLNDPLLTSAPRSGAVTMNSIFCCDCSASLRAASFFSGETHGNAQAICNSVDARRIHEASAHTRQALSIAVFTIRKLASLATRFYRGSLSARPLDDPSF